MQSWQMYDVVREQHLDVLRRAEHERLIRSLRASGAASTASHSYLPRRTMAALGRGLVSVGLLLQPQTSSAG
jgi:hypothetical protein